MRKVPSIHQRVDHETIQDVANRRRIRTGALNGKTPRQVCHNPNPLQIVAPCRKSTVGRQTVCTCFHPVGEPQQKPDIASMPPFYKQSGASIHFSTAAYRVNDFESCVAAIGEHKERPTLQILVSLVATMPESPSNPLRISQGFNATNTRNDPVKFNIRRLPSRAAPRLPFPRHAHLGSSASLHPQ